MKAKKSTQQKLKEYSALSKTVFRSRRIQNLEDKKSTNTNNKLTQKILLGVSTALMALPTLSIGQGGGCGGAFGVMSNAGAGNGGGPGIDVNGGGNDFALSVFNIPNTQVYLQQLGASFSVAYSGNIGAYKKALQLATNVTIGPGLNWTGQSYAAFMNEAVPGALFWHPGDSGYLPIRKDAGGGNFNYGFIKITIVNPFTSGSSITIDINDSGISTTTAPVLAGNCATLPVELIAFSAKTSSREIILNWQTASEMNNAGFEIQRSMDGNNFQNLNFVEGKGNTSELQNYIYEDKDFRKGKLYYYRLKQIDFDGQFEYSHVITAQVELEESSVVFSPNPTANGKVHLDYSANQNGTISLTVYDVSGKELIHQSHLVTEGTNSISLDFSSLGKGMFFVKISQEMFSDYQKIVIE